MYSIKKGVRRGALFGVTLVLLLALGTAVKLLAGASWEVIEWTGVVGLVLGFPLSLVADSLTGLLAFVVLVLAIIANWAFVGLIIGILVSLQIRLQDRTN